MGAQVTDHGEVRRLRRSLVVLRATIGERDGRIEELGGELALLRRELRRLREGDALGKLRALLTAIHHDYCFSPVRKEAMRHPAVLEGYRLLGSAALGAVDELQVAAEEQPLAALERFGLPVRVINALEAWTVRTVAELLVRTQEWVIAIPGLGTKALVEIHQALRAAGYLGAEEALPRDEE